MTNAAPADGLDRRLLLGAGALFISGCTEKPAGQSPGPGPAAPASGYAPVDGLRVYYQIHGGPLGPGKTPLVLMHGGMLDIETAFAGELLPRLAKSRPVIAIEQQGHGHTADRDGPITLDRMVDDTAGVMAHLAVEKAHLLGHSLGAMIAVGMAIKHPGRVASLTPVSGTYNLDGMKPELAAMQRGSTRPPSADLVPLLPTEADFNAWRASFTRKNPDPAAFDRVLTELNVMLGSWPGWTQAQLRAIRAPTLIIIGDNDFTRVEHAAEMAQLIPGAQLAVLPGTTHMNIIKRGAWIEPLLEARLGGG